MGIAAHDKLAAKLLGRLKLAGFEDGDEVVKLFQLVFNGGGGEEEDEPFL
jgi:hypothetical protein